jgi:hypothetical protein
MAAAIAFWSDVHLKKQQHFHLNSSFPLPLLTILSSFLLSAEFIDDS